MGDHNCQDLSPDAPQVKQPGRAIVGPFAVNSAEARAELRARCPARVTGTRQCWSLKRTWGDTTDFACRRLSCVEILNPVPQEWACVQNASGCLHTGGGGGPLIQDDW